MSTAQWDALEHTLPYQHTPTSPLQLRLNLLVTNKTNATNLVLLRLFTYANTLWHEEWLSRLRHELTCNSRGWFHYGRRRLRLECNELIAMKTVCAVHPATGREQNNHTCKKLGGKSVSPSQIRGMHEQQQQRNWITFKMELYTSGRRLEVEVCERFRQASGDRNQRLKWNEIAWI